MLSFIQTEKGLSLVLSGKMRTLAAGEANYEEVLNVVKRGGTEAEVLAILNRDLARATEAVDALAERSITMHVSIRGGQVLFRGKEVHTTLTARMLVMLDEGFDLRPLALFLTNLMQNPSHRAVQDLYTFLDFGKMPITEAGYFLAYKAVNPDYTDIYTSTISNKVGEKPQMPRNQVDEDPDRTCSKGFHVCSFDYLPNFAHNDGHVMLCKVNPRDVVAIPRDYNNTKMRVCEYEVIGEYEGYYTEQRSHVLSNTTVATAEEPFLVVTEGTEPQTLRFATLEAADTAMAELRFLPTTEWVHLKNGITGAELDSFENEDFEGYPEEDDFEGEEDLEDEEDFEDDEDAEDDGAFILDI